MCVCTKQHTLTNTSTQSHYTLNLYVVCILAKEVLPVSNAPECDSQQCCEYSPQNLILLLLQHTLQCTHSLEQKML